MWEGDSFADGDHAGVSATGEYLCDNPCEDVLGRVTEGVALRRNQSHVNSEDILFNKLRLNFSSLAGKWPQAS